MPEPAQITRHDRDGVAVLTVDVPDQRTNTITDRTFTELAGHVRAVGADDGVVAAVLTSGKPGSFCSGADIGRLPELAAADEGEALALLAAAQDTVRAVAAGAKPFVAAIHGAALGGGLELALACHARVATVDDATRFAFPEVKLGLLPGAGGTQYFPRTVPLPLALDHLLTGKTMYGARALATGLLDDLVPRNQLLDAAVAMARELAAGARPLVHERQEPPEPATLEEVLAGARALAAEATKGLLPAPPAILDVVETGLRDGLDAGFAAERETFLSLLRTPEAAAALHLFQATEAAKRRAGRDRAAAVRKVFVLGGGMMGAGLGAVAADHRTTTRVRDLDEGALARVRDYADAVLRRRYGKRRAAFPYLYRDRIHRLSTTTTLDGAGTADVVIEAVYEDLALKHRVLAEAEARMRPGAVLASNTSAIPITRLAEACRRPERFVGMHFFSPVEKMPLVEVVPHAGTGDEALETALALALRLDKVPIVVGDAPGFYTSRVFGRWLAEGTRLLLEGASVTAIDAAATALGFPVGPMTAYDEVSLTLASKAWGNPEVAPAIARGHDFSAVGKAVAALVEAGHGGRSTGSGFYTYDAEGRRAGPHPDVHAVVGAAAGDADEDTIADRLLYAFISEALAAFDDGLLRSTADGDVGAVLGIGFPPNLGGPFHYVEGVGAATALATLESLEAEHGGFPPGSWLRARAGEGPRPS